ncbi:MAG: L-histidine N(alpha)-methyltransferase [candidate division SR1 bacterium]|nr:L-histidine N(alpha)-methyltransferase [candidate division SR1 bacterium]
MKNTITTTEYTEYEKMFTHITDISCSENIAPFSTDIQKVIASAKQDHKDECDHLKTGTIGPFTRTIVMKLPLKIHTQEGKAVDMECKIQSRTMQNMINDNIVKNIRSAGSIDLLDIDFELAFGSSEYSEYHFSQEDFYMNIKRHIIHFIKKNPEIEKTIVDNYCDGLSATLGYIKTKEHLVGQREETTRELFMSLGMPKEFVLSEHNKVVGDGAILSTYGSNRKKILLPDQKKAFKKLMKIGNEFRGFDSAHEIKRYIEDMKKDNEEIQKIVVGLQKGKKDIQLDSKFFFLDNGDNLYDDVIEHSEYNIYYREELNLIQNNKKRISPYLKNHYIGLGCGNGKKDYTMISENIGHGFMRTEPESGQKITKVLLVDSSLRSLSKAEKIMKQNTGDSGLPALIFSQERIDTLLQNNEIKTLTSVTHYPKESIFNLPDIRESSNMFSLFGGTFGNFESYKKKFLQQMNALMNEGDVLCISLFNPPTNKEEEEVIVRKYDTIQTRKFIKNFFIKLGIPEDCIDVRIVYNSTTHAIDIDAKIHSQNNTPITIRPTGEEVVIPEDTIFHCISSQRMDEQYLQKCINQSQTLLKISDKITAPNNPFTLYMISK